MYNSNEGQELLGKKETAQEEEEDGSKGGTMQMLTTPEFVCVIVTSMYKTDNLNLQYNLKKQIDPLIKLRSNEYYTFKALLQSYYTTKDGKIKHPIIT